MVIVKTPMLVPLLRFIEEGSDKLVALSLCIDKFIYTIFKERFDTDIYLNTSEKERVSCADDLKNNIVRSALQEFDVKHGVEITFLSDIPTAQSLEMGTRAAFATSLVHGLSSFTGHLVSSEDLARLTFGILSPLEDSPWLRHEVDAVSRGGFVKSVMQGNGIVTDRLWLEDSYVRKLGSRLQLFQTNISSDDSEEADLTDFSEELIRAASADDYDQSLKVLGEAWENHTNSCITKIPIMKKIRDLIHGCRFLKAATNYNLLIATPRHNQDRVIQHLGDLMEYPFNIERYPSRVTYFLRRYPWK